MLSTEIKEETAVAETPATAAYLEGVEYSHLLNQVRTYMPPADVEVIDQAVHFGGYAHRKQIRNSGERYISHPIAAAYTCAQLQLDRDVIVGALLHDVPEDTDVTLEEIQHKFGEKVARLVDGVTKLGKLKWPDPTEQPTKAQQDKHEQAENLRKMFLAMIDDVRVVLIKLADRLHNMQTLQYKSREKQVKIATETMEIFAPLANRLGIWHLKWQLEDLCFKYLHPVEYADLTNALNENREERAEYLEQVKDEATKALEEAGINVMSVSGRPKHVYSIYRKMQRKQRQLDQIYDLLAIRIMVETVRDCYAALGVIHTLWRPVPGEFDDYIAMPKQGIYQSLHTAVIALNSRHVEVQIRTKDMHDVAEYGVAAHWRYKEGGKRNVEMENKIAWLRRLLEWKNETSDDAIEFVDNLKADVFQDQVYVFTPKGDIIELPAGATPLDFAYRIHSDVGNQCSGARVNDRLVPLNYQLQNGEVIKINTAKSRRGPSRDWLDPNQGYLKTASAREKVRQWFRREERDENITHGKQKLDSILKQLGAELKYEAVADHFSKYEKLDDFLAAIGYGAITVNQIMGRLSTMKQSVLPEFNQPVAVSLAPGTPATPTMTVGGAEGLLTTLATCCHPMKGDKVVGFVTRGRGITVHRADCPNVAKLSEDKRDRLINVSWGEADNQYYRVPIRVEAYDRMGLMRDVTALVADEKVNIGDVRTLFNGQPGTMSILLSIDVTGLEQLVSVIGKLQAIRNVTDVRREVPVARK
jgi:GTP diphosphokinase / guanosine-3',5'-bis(diphosphate) 3'-diphosphatase